jgi:hypothetical protein
MTPRRRHSTQVVCAVTAVALTAAACTSHPSPRADEASRSIGPATTTTTFSPITTTKSPPTTKTTSLRTTTTQPAAADFDHHEHQRLHATFVLSDDDDNRGRTARDIRVQRISPGGA